MSYMESKTRLHTEQANAPLNLTRTFAVSTGIVAQFHLKRGHA